MSQSHLHMELIDMSIDLFSLFGKVIKVFCELKFQYNNVTMTFETMINRRAHRLIGKKNIVKHIFEFRPKYFHMHFDQ